MHQEHNIPWNLFSSNIKYVHEDKSFTPPRIGYLPLGRPNQTSDLNHFVRKMISVIREFSATERVKYPQPVELSPPSDDNLFSDQLRDKYPNYLGSQNQKLSYWIRSAHVDGSGNPMYVTSHGRLADAMKILIHENQMKTLLMLANHPRVPLHHLRYLSWGHHFGAHRIVETALIPYIFWNFMAASGRLASRAYKNETYGEVVKAVTRTMDHEAQQVPHWEFYGVNTWIGDKDPMPEVDYRRLHDYLKHLFNIFFRYDMIMVECGTDPTWESEIVTSIAAFYRFNWSVVQDEKGRRIHRFV
jgi:hypothetical protein